MNALPNWMTTSNTPQQNRYYFRCHDCLLTTCIELQRPRRDLICGICGGPLDLLGVVEGNKWMHRTEVCTCNEMCQDARGPKCTCSCGGVNHGKGYRYYTYVDAQGKINVMADVDEKKCRAIAAEYRAAESAAVERIHRLPHYSDYQIGKYISRDAWMQIHNAIGALNMARKGANHKSRMSKMEKVA